MRFTTGPYRLNSQNLVEFEESANCPAQSRKSDHNIRIFGVPEFAYSLPLEKSNHRAILSKISNRYNGIRQTVGGDSGKRGLFSQESWLERLTEASVATDSEAAFRGISCKW
jgi:hypothetical protein